MLRHAIASLTLRTSTSSQVVISMSCRFFIRFLERSSYSSAASGLLRFGRLEKEPTNAMHSRLTIVLAACAAAASFGPLTAQTTTLDASPAIEEITVIGRYPGPPLWRVSSGDRVLWIFGELSPVPKGLEWDPRNAERVLDRADAVIGPPRVSAPTYNPIKLFRLFREAKRLSRNEGDATLSESLPPELNARYQALRTKHMPDEKPNEELRPALAVLRLYSAALDDVGLTTDSKIGSTVRRMMRRSKAEETDSEIRAKPDVILEELRKVSRDAELNCFASTLTSLETDLDGMKERANAWAIGDVDALKRFDYPDPQGDCLAMLFSASGLANLRDELYATWLGEAERALATHTTTFTVLPMRELVAADGLLAQLAARGYTVTAP